MVIAIRSDPDEALGDALRLVGIVYCASAVRSSSTGGAGTGKTLEEIPGPRSRRPAAAEPPTRGNTGPS